MQSRFLRALFTVLAGWILTTAIFSQHQDGRADIWDVMHRLEDFLANQGDLYPTKPDKNANKKPEFKLSGKSFRIRYYYKQGESFIYTQGPIYQTNQDRTSWRQSEDTMRIGTAAGNLQVTVSTWSDTYGHRSVYGDGFQKEYENQKKRLRDKVSDLRTLGAAPALDVRKVTSKKTIERYEKTWSHAQGVVLKWSRSGTIARKIGGARKGPDKSWSSADIHEPASVSGPYKIQAVARFRYNEVHVEISVKLSAWEYGSHSASQSLVDSIIEEFVSGLLKRPGVGQGTVPANSEQPAEEQTIEDEATAVQPEEESPRPLLPEPDPEPEEEEIPRDVLEAMRRISWMDDEFKGMEDHLQGYQIMISSLTTSIQRVREQVILTQKAWRTESKEEREQKLKRELDALREELRVMYKSREQLVQEASAFMKSKMDRMEELYYGHGFGDLEGPARMRYDAMTQRGQYFEAQIFMSQDDSEKALKIAEKFKYGGQSSMGYFLEGMAFFQMAARDPSKLASALNAFRLAKQAGYRGKDFDKLEAAAEIAVLRAIQQRASGEARLYKQMEDQWTADAAEANVDPERTFFKRWWDRIVWSGWYQNVQGAFTGAEEAMARADEMGVKLDSLARTRYSLEIVIRLRRAGYGLDEIPKMTGDEFVEAVRAAWEYEIDPETGVRPQVRREDAENLRRIVMQSAFDELPDVQALTRGDLIGEGELFSQALLDDLKDKDFLSYGKRALLDTSSAFAGIVNGWTVFWVFAPMGTLGAVKESGRVYYTGQMWRLQSKAKGYATLGQFFAASSPVQTGVKLLSKVPGGQKAIAAMDKVYRFQSQGVPQAVGVGLASALLQAKVSQVVQENLGENARLVADILSGFVMAPDIWNDAFRTAGVLPRQAANMARSMRSMAQTTQKAATEMRDIAKQARSLLAEGMDEAKFIATYDEVFERTSKVAKDIPQVQSHMETVLRNAELGQSAAALRELAEIERLINQAVENGNSLLSSANRMDDIAKNLDPPPPAPSSRLHSVADDLEIPSSSTGREALEELPTTAKPGAKKGEAFQSNDPDALDPRGLRGDVELAKADALLSSGKHADAAIEYRRLLADAGEEPAKAAKLQRRLMRAQRAEQEAARRAADQAKGTQVEVPKTRGLDDPFDPEFNQTVAEAVHNGYVPKARLERGAGGEMLIVPAHLQTVDELNNVFLVRMQDVEIPGKPPTQSMTSPTWIVDKNGKPIGVLKRSMSGNGHHEWLAEDLSSRLSEAMEQPTALTRKAVFNINGKDEMFIVSKTLPQGQEFGELYLGPGQKLAYQEELADDLVDGLFFGDADRHGGNLFRTDAGELIPIDRGLADPLPLHGDYRRPDDVMAMIEHQRLRQFQLDDLLNRKPVNGTQAQLDDWQRQVDDLKGGIDHMRQGEEIWGLYWHRDAPHPLQITTREQMLEFAELTMERHFDYIARQWGLDSEFLQSSLGYQHFEKKIAKLKAIRDQVPDIVEQAYKTSHPVYKKVGEQNIQFTKDLLDARIEVLEKFLKNKFPPFEVPLSVLRPVFGRNPHVQQWRMAA